MPVEKRNLDASSERNGVRKPSWKRTNEASILPFFNRLRGSTSHPLGALVAVIPSETHQHHLIVMASVAILFVQSRI